MWLSMLWMIDARAADCPDPETWPADAQFVCIDVTGTSGPGKAMITIDGEPSGDLRTNRHIVVGVTAETGVKVAFDFVSPSYGYESAISQPQPLTEEKPKETHLRLFPPIRSGTATLKVTVGDVERLYTWLVDRQVFGAFHYGLALGVPFGGNRYPYERFEPAVPNGSATAVVSDTGRAAWIATEVTFGIDLYFREVLESERYRPQFSWYFGMGILNGNATDVFAVVPSVHTGPMLSLSPEFGFGLTASVRYANALGQGAVIGGPVPASGLPKQGIVVPQVGLILAMSSANLELAAKKVLK